MAARRKKTTEQLCEEHFPDGWDGIDEQQGMVGVRVNGVGCEHGTWSRDSAPAEPKDPDGGDGGGQGNEDK